MKYLKNTILSLLLLSPALTVCSQDNTIQKQKYHFGKDQDTSAGYAQAVKVDNVIYISGTVAVDISVESIQRCYANIERTLKYFGASFQNVVKENLYTTDIEAVKQFNYARKPFYKGDFPAATWVQIDRLFMGQAKLEVEIIAYLPRK